MDWSTRTADKKLNDFLSVHRMIKRLPYQFVGQRAFRICYTGHVQHQKRDPS